MPRQSDLRFTFQPLASEAQFEVIDFDLEEGLSQPFRLALTLSSHDPDIAFAGLLDNPARFTLWQGEAWSAASPSAPAAFAAPATRCWSSPPWHAWPCAPTGAFSRP
ncbi:hypothetical protein D3C77_03500 [compost metagenome]